MSEESSALRRDGILGWLTLFSSSGTLICCALPIALVTLGLGASLASLTNAFPFLIFLSLHKIWVFAFSALMLILSGFLLYRPGRTCPTDPDLAAKCETAHRWNKRIFKLSVVIWTTGFAAAFLALPLLELYDRTFSG